MSIFDQQKKNLAEQRKPFTTVIQVEEYKLGTDKSKNRMIGKDLYNLDENGVPKTVSVAISNPNNTGIRGVANFGKRGDMVHTEVGGMIRLDRAVKRGGGSEYVAPHAQRISMSKDMMRTDDNSEEYKIAFAKSYVKVAPLMDRQKGEPREFPTSKQGVVIHRGTAFIFPEENTQEKNTTELKVGAGFEAAIRKLAEQAIDGAPEKTQPLVMLRDPDPANVSEMRVPNLKKDEKSGNYVSMTKEESLDAFMETQVVKAFVQAAAGASEGSVEGITGFSVAVFGNPYDEKGNRTTSRVEAMANETLRRFPRPDHNGERQEPVKGNQEYAFGIVSYTIAQGERNNANLESIGRMPGVKATPNAGLSVTENPYWPRDDQGNMVSFTNSAAAPAPEAAPAAAPAAAAAQAASQPASQAQSASAELIAAQAPIAKPAAQEAKFEEPPLPSDDDMDSFFGADSDYDMEELESQMQGQGM